MKKYVFKFVAALSMITFFIGIHPTCSSWCYQQELPDELK